MKSRLATVCVIAAMTLPCVARAQLVNLSLQVEEPSGVVRTNDPVTTGVPIPTAAVGAQWSLFDGVTPIPVQTTVLSGYRTPWLLLDFRASVGGNVTKTYQLLSNPPSVTPNPSISVTENISTITVTTGSGALKVIVKKDQFNLIDQLWMDRNGDGTFQGSEKLVNTTSSDNLPLVDAANVTFAGKGAGNFVWEDVGLLRRTLRVDGVYGSAGSPLLMYTTRITFHAGQPYLTVKHLIRNSFQFEERYVKVKSAHLKVGTSATTARLPRAGDNVWVDASVNGGRVELIPPTWDGVTNNVDANGGMVIGDWSYHGGGVRFDFTPSMSGPEQTARTTTFNNRLMARAPASWYSDLGAFGSEKFGTYDEEKQAYTQWGWTWPNPNNSFANEHALPRPSATYFPSWSSLKPDDLEADDLWMHLMMWARVGLRTYLDRADRWARYESWEYMPRTDNFPYAWNDFWEGPSPVERTRVDLPGGFTPADNDYINLTIKKGKAEGVHSWNGGLVDYYYVNGDRDALQAAIDLAEHSRRITNWLIPGCLPPTPCYSPHGSPRSQARSYMKFLRVWEATSDAAWRSDADHLRELFLQSQRWDARGFFYSEMDELTCLYPPGCAPGQPRDLQGILWTDRFPNGKYVSPFQLGVTAQAFYRDWVLTGNTQLQQRLTAIASFAYQFGNNPTTGFTGDDMVIDSPTLDNVQHMSHAVFRNAPDPFIYSFPSSSTSFIDALTIGYRLTGNCGYLSRAKLLWDRASKGFEPDPYAGPTQVGHFMNSMEGWSPNNLLYPFHGELTGAQFFFYEAPRTTDYANPPSTITDLGGPLGATTAALSWTAPHNGEGGQATAFDLRYAPYLITESNFSSATAVATVAPGPQGTIHCAEFSGLIPCTQYWFAIRTSDGCGNLSSVSNVHAGITRCPPSELEFSCENFLRGDSDEVSAPLPTTLEFSSALNPVVGAATLKFGIPLSQVGSRLVLSVYDVAGRRVRQIQDNVAQGGRFSVGWDLRDDQASPVARGVYMVRLSVGTEVRVQKLVVAR